MRWTRCTAPEAHLEPAASFGDQMFWSSEPAEGWLRTKRGHYSCVLCALNSEETVQHLFLECEMSKACWNLLGITIDLALDPLQIFESFRVQLNVTFSWKSSSLWIGVSGQLGMMQSWEESLLLFKGLQTFSNPPLAFSYGGPKRNTD